jgi:elongation of very long chain fatty acids protein 6
MGYVQIEDHEPWSWEALLFVCGVALSLLVTRAIYQLLAPIVGKRLGVWLHGPEWLTKGHGGTLDWRRFADVCFFSTQHICLTTYASTALGGEIRSWLDDPSTSWFAFFQPALSDPLRAYYLFQLGVALEASLTMARSVAKGRTKDWPMVVHHAATLFVIIFANRLGFLRVGVFVVALHDATDIPIDGISISQALELKNGRVVSAIAGAASWAYLRGWVFARHVIGVIAFETGHIWRAYSVKHEGFVGDLTLIAGYSIFLVPLVLLWLLSCYEWLPKLTKKIVSSVTGSSKFADQLVDLATVGGMLCVAVSTLSNYLPSAALAHPEPFAQERVALLKTRECLYHNLTTVWDASALELLKPVIAPECDAPLYTGRGAVSCDAAFDGGEWSRWSQSNWHLPLLSVLAYLIAIPTLTRLMAPRQPMKIRAVVALWNFGLALFSIIGVSHVVPELLAGGDGLLTRGYYASVCRHASSYGCGDVGLWVLLFILSKFAELFDTMFLVLRKNAVIPLHWYHHATVLLYCWHSYASRIGTGLWFASMNYCVHSIMYFYFGLTQCGPRAKAVAKRFSMLITLLQLSQMVVGIVVTISSIVYHAHGATCYVSLLNSILGLAMYTSYFILFFALFQTLYLTKKNKNREAERKNPPPHPPQKPTTSEALEGWAVGKGKEIELVAETGSEAFLDLCSAGQREADVESKKSR